MHDISADDGRISRSGNIFVVIVDDWKRNLRAMYNPVAIKGKRTLVLAPSIIAAFGDDIHFLHFVLSDIPAVEAVSDPIE